MNIRSLVFGILALLIVSGCKKSVTDSETPATPPVENPVGDGGEVNKVEPADNPPASQMDLRALPPTPEARQAVPIKAEEVVQALKSRNLQRLAQLVHPQKGLKFTPEVYVDPSHQVFSVAQIPDLMEDRTEYTWGKQDGSGKTIRSTFATYYDRYIYDADFAGSDSIFYNQTQQHGNVINNVPKAYPGCIVVEYFLPEVDPKLMGLDWRALRMVFEPYQGDWYLVGLVHAAWTP